MPAAKNIWLRWGLSPIMLSFSCLWNRRIVPDDFEPPPLTLIVLQLYLFNVNFPFPLRVALSVRQVFLWRTSSHASFPSLHRPYIQCQTHSLPLSSRAISSLYTNDGDMEALEADLRHRFSRQEWDLAKSLQKTIQAARSENYSLTDFWAYMVISKQTREVSHSPLGTWGGGRSKGSQGVRLPKILTGTPFKSFRTFKTSKSGHFDGCLKT